MLARAGYRAIPDQRAQDEIPTLAHSSVMRVPAMDPDGAVVSLIVKRSRPGAGAFLTLREARFYRGIAPSLPAGLVPRCFLAETADEAATLILEDMGETHAPMSGETPTFDRARQFVEALAELHAAAGNMPALAVDWASEVGDGVYDTVAGRLALQPRLLPQFSGALKPELDDWTLALLSGFGRSESLAAFAREPGIMHGDAHYGNGLFAAGGAALIDWGNACLGPGEIDLAHAIALNLPRELRRDWERPLIEAYTSRLNLRGVSRTPAETHARYRLGVLYAVTVPVGHWRSGLPPWRALWGNIISAAKDLGVESLL